MQKKSDIEYLCANWIEKHCSDTRVSLESKYKKKWLNKIKFDTKLSLRKSYIEKIKYSK